MEKRCLEPAFNQNIQQCQLVCMALYEQQTFDSSHLLLNSNTRQLCMVSNSRRKKWFENVEFKAQNCVENLWILNESPHGSQLGK